MVLMLMGIIFAGLGIAFYVLGAGDSLVGGTFSIIAFTFVPVGAFLFLLGIRQLRGSARRSVLLQTGIPGTATVTALSDTGITINENPMANVQFLVQVPGMAPYPVTKRMALPRLMVGRLAPGVTIPVKVDPADPQELAIEWDQPSVMPGGFGGLMGGAYPPPGTPGAATGFPSGPMPGAAGFGGQPFVTTSTTVIDATGGHAPVAYVTSSGLDQATLDQINRTLYERGVTGGDAATAAQAMAGGATVEQVLAAIGRGPQQVPGAAPSTGITGASASAAAGSASRFGLLDAKEAERLSAVGYTGRATIGSFSDTGIATGDDHLYTFGFTVHVDGRPDEQVRHAAMVPHRAVSRISAGASLPVRVDPLDASKLIVEWDKG